MAAEGAGSGGAGALAGRGAVVTGGGRGIGRAVARALADAGAAVVVSARGEQEIRAVAGEVREAGGRATAIACDVADPKAVRELGRAAREWLAGEGRTPDVLVQSAGAASSAPIRDLRLEEWNRLLAVNATGAFLCLREFLPDMEARGWGRVVHVASVAGVAGAPYIAAYAASKHAVVGLTRCAAAEVAARGVTVNAVCPGYVDTGMTEESVRRIAAKTGRSEEEALRALLARHPQGRLIEPEEVAHAVLALCADGARGINGRTIVIDGGELPA